MTPPGAGPARGTSGGPTMSAFDAWFFDGLRSMGRGVRGAVGGVLDVAWQVTELAAAAARGAARGAAAAVAEVWAADRPRRQRVRYARRRRWWSRGGWRRGLVAVEIVILLAALTALSVARILLAAGAIGAAAGRGARNGWTGQRPTAKARARARRGHRRPDPGPGAETPNTAAGVADDAGPAGRPPRTDSPGDHSVPGPPVWVRVEVVDDPVDVVQGEIVCGVVDSAGRPCPSPVPPGAARCDSHISAPADPVPNTPSEPTDEVDAVVVEAHAHPDVDAPAGADETPASSWCWGTPLTVADRRRVALREAGYRGWIDWDGYAVAEPGPARRLTESEVAEAIAGDGYHPSPAAGAASGHPSQSPDGRSAAGSEHDVLARMRQQEMEEPVEQTVTAMRRDEQVAQVRVGGGLASAAGLSGELEHIADLDAEAATVAGVIEQAQVLAQTLRTWQDRLPERSAGVLGSTQGVEAAVTATAEAPSTAELRDVLADLRREIEGAHQVGDGLTAAGVSGDVAGITPR